ncbi:MAG TPA: citryl-CoA lyase [Acidimicrobiales bacterium]|nr:citryl-CoA lyase [Acidimicrobiales bacterium]
MSGLEGVPWPEGADWWATSIAEIRPGVIRFRGYPVEELIGNIGLAEVIWLLIVGELPSAGQASLLEAALVASVDHGPQAPSIASARMAATTGVGLNSAIATGVNMLGDVHGGAGQQCMELYLQVAGAVDGGATLASATSGAVAEARRRDPFVPGFGHRFHPVDPRVAPLLDAVRSAAADDVVGGRFVGVALAVEREVAEIVGRPVPMNIDGATAVVFCELGLEPPLGRGLFVLSRSVGILAHAWEETTGPSRLKGPMPPSVLPTYTGPDLRHVE